MYSQKSILSNLNVTWTTNVFASFMVVLVTIPFSIAIAIASGIPVEKTTAAGLVTVMIDDIIIMDCLSGNALQASSPSTALPCWSFNLFRNTVFKLSALYLSLFFNEQINISIAM